MEGDLLDELINAAENLVNKSAVKEIDLFNQKEDEVINNTDDKSLVHTGLSDSSDDEDNKYFEEAKYNDCGKTIKHLIQSTASEGSYKSETWKPPVNSNIKTQPVSKTTTPNEVLYDPIFGIRIINPLVSSKVLQERMVGRESVQMSKLKWYLQKLTPDKDWAMAGVIVNKSASKTSQKGNQFCIWSISDLGPGLKIAAVFLFGKAYQHLWKTTIGTVVGILNPNVLDKKDGSKDEACLSIDNHQKVMIIGQSKDFGICKSVKKSGGQCTSFVNTSQTEHCNYHLKYEYEKYSKRSEMQSSFAGRGLTALRNKVLGKNEVFYAGKLYTSIPATKSKKLTVKDQGRLKSLTGQDNVALNTNQLMKSKNLASRKMTASRVELTKNQRAKDLALLTKLGDLNDKIEFSGNLSREVSLGESKQIAVSVIDKLKNRDNGNVNNEDQNVNDNTNSTGKIIKDDSNHPLEERTKPTNLNNRSFLNSPVISPSLNGNGKPTIDLNSPISRKLINRAKLNAINYVQKNGGIKKSNPMSTKGTGKKRTIQDPQLIDENDPKKRKIQQNEFFSERFKKMMATTSAHVDLLEKHDDEEKEKYFKKLEIKEKMEEKMATTYKVECKAVRCLICKYTSFSATDRCKSEKHPLKVFDTFKRFFKCGNCGNRTVCLEVVPTIACKNCGSGKWERTSMMKEKIEQNVHHLSIRGGEQKFMNSTIGNANLDLMVPIE